MSQTLPSKIYLMSANADNYKWRIGFLYIKVCAPHNFVRTQDILENINSSKQSELWNLIRKYKIYLTYKWFSWVNKRKHPSVTTSTGAISIYISFFCRGIHSFNSVFVSVATLNIQRMHSKNKSVSLGTFPLYKKVLLDLIMSPHSLQPPLLSCLFVFKLGSALVDCPSQLICTWIFMTKLKAGKSARSA